MSTRTKPMTIDDVTAGHLYPFADAARVLGCSVHCLYAQRNAGLLRDVRRRPTAHGFRYYLTGEELRRLYAGEPAPALTRPLPDDYTARGQRRLGREHEESVKRLRQWGAIV